MIIKTMYKADEGIEVEFSSKVYETTYTDEFGWAFLVYLPQTACDEIVVKITEEYRNTMSEGLNNGDVIVGEDGKMMWHDETKRKCNRLAERRKRYLKAHFVCVDPENCELEDDDD